jgi:hypothetical protein
MHHYRLLAIARKLLDGSCLRCLGTTLKRYGEALIEESPQCKQEKDGQIKREDVSLGSGLYAVLTVKGQSYFYNSAESDR